MDLAPAGPLDALTDVPGVRVGHATRDEPGWLTGTTVVVPPVGTVGGVDVRGGGPGTRETDLLDPRHTVDLVDAVVLGGGSALGLAACDGVSAGLLADGRGWPAGPGPGEVVPIVPGAIVFDLGRGGVWGHHPRAAEGRAAYDAATTGPVDEGVVGAGTGARAGGLKGGVGTASAVLADGSTVAALVVVNAVGSPVAPDGRLLGAHLLGPQDATELPVPDPERVSAYWSALEQEQAALRAGTATTIAVVATDARLTKPAISMLARVAHDGMARAISPVHTAFDGDTVFTLATGEGPAPSPLDLVVLQTEAARCVTRAIVSAMLAATSVDRSADGGAVLSSYRDAVVG